MLALTTTDLVQAVREQCDETSIVDVGDDRVLAALNRGQRKASNIVARKYDELFWDSVSVASVAGQRDYDLPQQALGRRVEKIELLTDGNVAWEIKKISNQDRTSFVTNSQASKPMYWSQRKNTLQFYPIPNGSYTLVIHYTRAPERLVKPQGRVQTVGATYVLADELGDELSTSVAGYGAYVNWVSYATGAVLGTNQVQSLDTATNKLTIKTTGLTRTTVLGRTVTTALPTDLQPDDYVCLVTGSCVPELPEAYIDYVTQYAVLEVKRSHGEATQEEYAQLKELAEELEKSWSGRELTHRIRKASEHWTDHSRTAMRRYLS